LAFEVQPHVMTIHISAPSFMVTY